MAWVRVRGRGLARIHAAAQVALAQADVHAGHDFRNLRTLDSNFSRCRQF
jgi:hypothetical protein